MPPPPDDPGPHDEPGARAPAPGAGGALGARAAVQLGRVTAGLAHGESRPQQRQMCEAVGAAIEEGRPLVVQAGTGTGKSLAYLVPAALSGRKVVVSTATKALQDQLAEKDLPLIAAAQQGPFAFAVLKGRSNYLCRQRAVEVSGGGVQVTLGDQPTGDEEAADAGPGAAGPSELGLADQVRHILAWAETTVSGDRADLPFEPHHRAWAMLSVGPRECPGAFRCPSGGTCFAEAARAAAAAADLVVVNTHLYGAHLASGGAVLPEHDVVVFDEAHELEEIMTSSLGVEVSPGRLRALATMARPLLRAEGRRRAGGEVDDVVVVADQLQGRLAESLGQRVLQPVHPAGSDGEPRGRPAGRGEPEGRARVLPAAPPRRPAPEAVLSAADRQLADLLALATGRVQALLVALRQGDEAPSLLSPEGRDDSGRRARALSAAGHLAEDLGRLGAPGADEVAWVDGTARAPVLRLSPIDVGPPLAGALWDQVTAVLTSATIPARLAERVGLSGLEPTELDVGSPFDYRTHSLLYVARHLPDRRSPEAEPALHAELAALIGAAGGRTLGLFTSWRATEAAAEALRPVVAPTILLQGEQPKALLLRTFAEDESSCLFATLGFWQGVDVPGRALSLVTLDRLPFARPDDPLVQARRDRAGANAFRLVDLPRAATLLAQGAGRLIRSADDYGVVAVLDPRLATAGYRGVLLAGLPPMRRTTDRRQVEDFLRRILAHEHHGEHHGEHHDEHGIELGGGPDGSPAAR